MNTQHKTEDKDETEKCYLEYDESGKLVCTYNHKVGADCLGNKCPYCHELKCECYKDTTEELASELEGVEWDNKQEQREKIIAVITKAKQQGTREVLEEIEKLENREGQEEMWYVALSILKKHLTTKE